MTNDEAFELGQIAYHDGRDRAPALDRALIDALDTEKARSQLSSWLLGWDWEWRKQCRVDEAAMTHERAHAGISDPDTCDRGPLCPQNGTVNV